MSTAVRIHEPLGERAATLPLTLGDEGADLRVPGTSGVVLTLERGKGSWLARPAQGAGATVNGQLLREAHTLDEGDVIGMGTAQIVVRPEALRIDVQHLAGNATVAPLRDESLPGEEVVAGIRQVFAAGAGAATAGNRTAPLPGTTRRRSGRWWGAALAATVLVAVAGWLFALVPVPLQLTPAEARIHVEGIFDWQSGDRIFLLPGRRTLDISHPGYHSRQVTLDVTRELSLAAALPLELALLPGVLEVDTGGVSGELLVDGRVAGTVPGDVEVEAGARDVVVRAPRHVDHVTRLDIEGGGQRQALQVTLLPSIGWLELDTQPAGARVSVDGEYLGDAPQRLELDAGLRQLSIAAPGRRAWNSQVAIIAGQTLALGRVDLALPPPPRVATAPAPVPADSDTETGPVPPAPPPPPAARVRSDLLGTLLLMPAVRYVQGSDRREQGRRANEVQREVILTRAFYLGEHEVTNAQFRAFRDNHASGVALERSLDLDNQPVTGVSWNDAVEFCNWLSLREGLPVAYERRDGRWQLVTPHNQGYRLPTEAEWEYAARQVDGQKWQRYAWGDSLPPPAGAANLAGEESLPPRPGPDVRLATVLPGYRDEHPVVAPVGRYRASPAGFHDMGGNVSEWMHDVYISLPESITVTDPMGATTDGPHAIRGASWRTAAIAELRLAWRERAAGPAQTIGFRVARFAQEAP